jgi:hypothetical protein
MATQDIFKLPLPKSTTVKGTPNLERVMRNMNTLAEANAPANDISAYLAQEGFNQDSFTKAVENYNKSKGVIAEFGPFKNALQGLSFGWSDEAEAGIKALIGKGTYEQNLAAIRGAQAEYEASAPMTEVIGGKIVGSTPQMLLGGTGALNVARQMTNLSRVPKPVIAATGAAVSGGVSGAITGAGEAVEGGRAEGAMESGQLGTLFGPMGMTVAKGAQMAGRPVVEGARRLMGQEPLTDFSRRADVKLLQALQRDGIDLQDALDRLNQIRQSNYKPETIIELGGENTRRLADVVAQYPGPAQAARVLAEERIGGAPQRITQDFREALQVNADAFDLADNLIKTADAQADPLYKRAYREGGVIDDPRINKFMKIPQFQDAYRTARRLAALDGIELPPDPKKMGDLGGFDLMTLDYIKRGLDDVLFLGKAPTSGIGKTEMGKLKERRREFVNVIDEVGPASYKEARRAFAGPMEIYDAIEQGQKFTKVDPRQLRKTYDGLSTAEQEGFRIGVYDNIRETVDKGTDGYDILRRVWSSKQKRDQLASFIGPDAFEDLQARLVRERVIRETDTTMMGGSQTMRRTLAQRELEGEEELVPSLMRQGVTGTARNYLLRTMTGPGQPTAESLSSTLFSLDPNAQRQALLRLQSLDQLLREEAARGGGRIGTITGTQTGLLGE